MRLPSRFEQLEENLDTAYRKYEFKRGKLLTAVDDDQQFKLREDMVALSKEIATMETDLASLIDSLTDAIELNNDTAEPLVGEWLQATEKTIQLYQGGTDQNNTELVAKLDQLLTELQTGKAASAKLKITLPIIPLLVSYDLELDSESTLLQLWRKTRNFFKQEVVNNPK